MGYVCVEIRRGMYGFRKPGASPMINSSVFLAPHGYQTLLPLTPGLWTHTSRDIVFSLVVDDFGMRYTSQSDADHLIATLAKRLSGQRRLDRRAILRLDPRLGLHQPARATYPCPGTLHRALQRFQHVAHHHAEHAPHPWQTPQLRRQNTICHRP
jgi:hypothetical protein